MLSDLNTNLKDFVGMDYEHIRLLRKLLYVLYKLDLSEQPQVASVASGIFRRVDRQMKLEANQAAKKRILG